MKLLLDPHGDDAALFAAYTCIAEKPHVLVTHPTVAKIEIDAAMGCLGLEWEAWTGGKWSDLGDWLESFSPEVVYAPHFDFALNGHKVGQEPPSGWGVLQHDMVGWIAQKQFGESYRGYCLYSRWNGRMTGTEVIPPPGAVAKKLRALSCYESEIEQASTRPWFFNLLDMREWVP